MKTDAPDGHFPRPTRRGILARLTALAAAGAVGVLASGCGAPASGTAPAPPIPAPAVPAPLTGPDVNAWLDGLLPAALEKSGIAGAVVTVVHNGEILTARGYGYADTGSEGTAPRRVDPDQTLFRVGSVSKVFVATAVMQLVEQGRIDLDADVGQYLDFPLPRKFDQALTMRHLLSHTPGFEERIRNLLTLGESTVNLRDYLAVDPPEQVFAPGTVPAYSNYGYSLAGYIVERVSGLPFDVYIERNVLDRAGMTSSTFAQPLPPDLRSRLSQAYPTDSEPPVPFETVGAAPAGALSASATDMGRFLLAHLGELGPEQSLLGPATLAQMREPALDSASLGTLAGAPRMTLGFFDESRNGHRMVGHGGDTNYFHSHMQLYPDDRTGVFVSFNGNGRAPADTLEWRESLLFGFADRYFPPVANGSAPRMADTGHAAMAEGSYESARGTFSTFLSAGAVQGQTRVTARPDGTVLVEPGSPVSLYPLVYEEIEPWVWREVGGQRTMAMRANGDRVDAIVFESAFTLLPTGSRDATVALPVLLASAGILLVSLLAWPIGAIIRRRYSLPASASMGRVGRTANILTRIATAVAVLTLAGWTMVILTVSSLQDVPEELIRALQVAQWAALIGVLPAAIGLVVAVRRRAGTARVLGSVLPLLALTGSAWFALVFGLLSPSVSY